MATTRGLKKLKAFILGAIKGDEPEEDWDEEYGRLEGQLNGLGTYEEVLAFGAEHTSYSVKELMKYVSKSK